MKFLVLALVAVTGISAASTTVTPGGNKDCDADYIVRQCLLTENDKVRPVPKAAKVNRGFR
jgi:hypothetical protein